VKESRQGSRAAAGRTSGKVKKASPQAHVGASRYSLRRQYTKPCHDNDQGQAPQSPARKQRHPSPLLQRSALRIGELVHRYKNEIDQPPDATAPKGYEFQNPQPNVPQVKAVHSKRPEEDGENQRHQPVLFPAPPEPYATLNADFRARQRLLPAGLAIAASQQRPLATANAIFRVVYQLLCTVSTIHKKSSHEGLRPSPARHYSWKLKNGSWKMETGKRKLEKGNWKLENRNWKIETGK
jgi:hypothetical protein